MRRPFCKVEVCGIVTNQKICKNKGKISKN